MAQQITGHLAIQGYFHFRLAARILLRRYRAVSSKSDGIAFRRFHAYLQLRRIVDAGFPGKGNSVVMFMQYPGFHCLRLCSLFRFIALATRQQKKACHKKNVYCFFQQRSPHINILRQYICYLIVYYFSASLQRINVSAPEPPGIPYAPKSLPPLSIRTG